VSSGAVGKNKEMMHLLSFVQHGVINHAQLMWAHPRDNCKSADGFAKNIPTRRCAIILTNTEGAELALRGW
jgi:hypothetical protein